MIRRSRREIARVVEKLEWDTHTDADGFNPDPLTIEEKRALADVFDTNPWNGTDTEAVDVLTAIHRS
ncbi:hypothetical protein [Haloferax sp. Q22]|uniref:hypothetical protein n=1 Tax=Haloferax sp. (strain Q22) TaxID=1526048 RepID=UPI000737B708|nr:hypothetical protein [Haloferax sp. Q22]